MASPEDIVLPILNTLSYTYALAFKAFAKPHNEGKFDGLDLVEGTPCPVFSACISYMQVQIKSSTDAGDHVVLVGEVLDGAVLNGDSEPMVHLRKNGFQY